MFQAHQGDVYLRQVKSVPKTVMPVEFKNGPVILAYGEVTGHCHAIHTPKVAMFRDDGGGGGTFINVPAGGASLTHEEHGAIAIPPGDYEVVVQSSYTPEAIRNVAD